MKLKPGQWFMWPVDDPMPETLDVFSGSVRAKTFVTEISRYQAMALRRWNDDGPIYYSYKDGNGRWRDVRVVGDVEAWFGTDDD